MPVGRPARRPRRERLGVAAYTRDHGDNLDGMRGIARGPVLAVLIVAVLTVAVAALTAGPAAAARRGDATATRRPGPTVRDDTSAVCIATAKTVSEGLDKFVAAMQAVSTAAGQGDLVAAERAVQSGGVNLVEIAVKLRRDGVNADDTQLKRTVADLAAEFERLGRSLTNLTALQTFDTTQLDGLASRMGDLCAGVTAPTPGPGEPSGTPRPSGDPTAGPQPFPTVTPGSPSAPAPREARVHDW